MRNSLAVALIFLCSCSLFEKQDFYYVTYTSPSLQFSIQYPKPWDLQEGGALGSQVIFSTNENKESFRANANIVVTNADNKNLESIMKLSVNQLKLILNQYELITQNKTQLGTLDAFELRGKYLAKEGPRIIRTVVAVQKDTEYVFTFTAGLDTEKNYTKIINYMIQSFHEKN